MFKKGDKVKIRKNVEDPNDPFVGRNGVVFKIVPYSANNWVGKAFGGGVIWVSFDGKGTKGEWGIYGYNSAEKI